MRTVRYLLGALLVFVGVGSAAAAVAVEGGWLTAIDDAERAEQRADQQAAFVSAEASALDESLEGLVGERRAVEAANDDLRRRMAERIARWDSITRTASRYRAMPGEDDSMGARAVGQINPSDFGPWRRDRRLYDDVAGRLHDGTTLLVQRSQLQIAYAQYRAQAGAADSARSHLIAAAGDEERAEEIDAEQSEAEQALFERLSELKQRVEIEDFHRQKGTLFPPVNRRPDKAFGPQQRPDSYTENRHTGLTYRVDVGTEVRSVADGVVADVDRLPGFGRVAIVDHGDEYHTVYAHLREFTVEPGDELDARDVVGHSGDSGSLDGPKLYFELRQRGRPVDPEEWFVSE